MAWNEPGKDSRDPDKNKNQNPWGGGDGKGPDLDAVLKRLRTRFGRFGRGGGPLLIIILLLVIWILIDSWVAINARQVGVVLRFGAYERTLQPGFHLKFPRPIEDVEKVATTKVRSYSADDRMLTKDENIMHIGFNVQYQVKDARDFLFSMRSPTKTLHEAAQSAVRSVIGHTNMDAILSGSGAELALNTQDLLQKTLDRYDSGILVTNVSFHDVAPPDQVKEAFDDVNKAREDKQRIQNLGRAYASKVVPQAKGQAARIIAEAEGYKAQRVALAKGNAKRFVQILEQYRAAPEVTRHRLWLETMENVLAGNRKVVDGTEGRNLLYLPAQTSADALSRPSPQAVGGAAAADDTMPPLKATAGGGQ